MLRFDLGDHGNADHLVLTGAGSRGTLGSNGYLFDFSGAHPAADDLYTLLTFDSTDFISTDFDYFGLGRAITVPLNLATTTCRSASCGAPTRCR